MSKIALMNMFSVYIYMCIEIYTFMRHNQRLKVLIAIEIIVKRIIYEKMKRDNLITIEFKLQETKNKLKKIMGS